MYKKINNGTICTTREKKQKRKSHYVQEDGVAYYNGGQLENDLVFIEQYITISKENGATKYQLNF